MKTRKPYPNQATVRHLFTLRRGQLFWAIRPSLGTPAGRLAGHLRSDGSRVIIYRRKSYMTHHLIAIYRGDA
jgi:hypothetical protein